ncbi:hypothetical protein D9757_004123 [Collybiopsis confluens]|uniref:Ankyrin n=1 Tax=Collybiopsis confluens TaxID=2823264 RepID=A0A8H5HUR7_9AGAR|nr:hypothetical protein D9757_004123 [Collybiopsis confluens]
MSETQEGASNNERLLAAARTDDEDMLLEVFETDVFDINFQDGHSGQYSFTHCSGSVEVLEHILSHEDCDVDPINRINRATPLHLACQLEDDGLRTHIVESLLDAGADTRIRDKKGELAIDFIPPRDDDTRKLFRKAQAAATVSKDDIASDDDGEAGSGSGSGSDED